MNAAATPYNMNRFYGRPGSSGPSFNGLSDDELGEREAEALKYIRDNVDELNRLSIGSGYKVVNRAQIELGADGLPTDMSLVERWARTRSTHRGVEVLKRCQLVSGIRDELKQRAERREREAKERHENARGKLEQLLADAPAMIAQFEASAAELNAAVEKLPEIERTLETLAGLAGLGRRYRELCEAIQVAARTLDREVPELPALSVIEVAEGRERIEPINRAVKHSAYAWATPYRRGSQLPSIGAASEAHELSEDFREPARQRS